MKHSMLKATLYAISLLILFLLFGLLFSQGMDEGSGPAIISDANALERQLEIGFQEKLVALKGNPQSVLAEFTTDGCSGGLSVGWEYLADSVSKFQETHGTEPAWQSCCVTHDQVYHTGGIRSATAEASLEARRKADLALKACVIETGVRRSPELMKEYNVSEKELTRIYNGIANMMYGAVRVGGMPCTDLPWRWGYGWPECQ